MYCKEVVWFILICVIKSVQLTENNTSSPALFTLLGQAALKTAYGHLVIPLNIPDIKQSFDRFKDLEKAMNQLTTGTDKMYAHRNTEIKHLKGKLNNLYYLALQRAKDTTFDKVDELKQFKDKLIQSLGIRQANGSLRCQPLQRNLPLRAPEEREI